MITAACGGPARPPDVILVTLDTTRQDALGAYGASPSPTPVLDAIAARGTLASEAMTTTPLTLPAHASLMTGQYPDRHGVRDNSGFSLPDSAETLAERMADAGYQTGAFISAIVLDGAFGLRQGFATYSDGFDLTGHSAPGDLMTEWPAETVVDRALDWAAGVPAEQPMFLWVHLYDPHAPYEAAPFSGSPYLGEVAATDAAVGRLLDGLAGRGDPIIAVTADHGESLGAHGEATHGMFVYRPTMTIPMMLAGPGVPAGTIDAPVSITDLAPTLLVLTGAAPLPDADGRSLLSPDPTRQVYGESFYGRLQYGLAPLRVLQDQQHRYIDAPRPELYDHRADPGERDNLTAGREPFAVAMAAFIDRSAAAQAQPGGVDPQVAAALQALGYLATPAIIDDEGALPDPKDHPDLPARFEQLVVDARTRPPEEAVPLLEAFLAEYPAVAAGWHLLSMARELSGDLPGALEALAPIQETSGADPALLARIASLHLDAGDLDLARQHAEAALAQNPDISSPLAVLSEMARREGDCAGAIAHADAGLSVDPESTALYTIRGACRLDRDDVAGALADLARATEGDPSNTEADWLLGLAQARSGQLTDALPRLRRQHAAQPDSTTASAALGMALVAEGGFAEAMPLLRAAAPDPAVGVEPPLLLADAILRTEGDPAEAMQWLTVATERAPHDPRIHRIRSAALMASGDVAGAMEAMKAAHAGGLADPALQ